MPDTALLRLEIHDWWHCSAGRGLRSGANALVLRDGELPFVPGRTLKGLLRDALHQAEQFSKCHAMDGDVPAVPADVTITLLGLPTGFVARDAAELSKQRFGTERGMLFIGNAVLPVAWRRWAATPNGANVLRDLTETLHRTAIDADGQVLAQSLRSIEVMPPMILDAELRFQEATDPWAEQGGWRGLVRAALPLLRGLGAGRTRGLGRVTAELHDHDTVETGA